MSLSAGTKLGPYQITDQIGAGGMGEVYRATDTRLDRTVAIKVLLSDGGNHEFADSLSPDGAILAIEDRGDSSDILTLEIEAGGDFEVNTQPIVWLQTECNEFDPMISPDGLGLAYTSNESGRPEIYVSPFPDANEGTDLVSSVGGVYPVWSPDGQELFYLEPGPTERLMAVPVETEQDFDRGTPQVLFEWQFVASTGGTPYDVSPDGRFLAISNAPVDDDNGETTVPKVNIVLNWFEELTERVPVP
jgi:hypothetical protein